MELIFLFQKLQEAVYYVGKTLSSVSALFWFQARQRGLSFTLPVVCMTPLKLGSAHPSQPSMAASIQTDLHLSLAFTVYL